MEWSLCCSTVADRDPSVLGRTGEGGVVDVEMCLTVDAFIRAEDERERAGGIGEAHPRERDRVLDPVLLQCDDNDVALEGRRVGTSGAGVAARPHEQLLPTDLSSCAEREASK